jgi:nitrogen fixation NifU-like protein
MSDLRHLYQELILDHSRSPHGFGLSTDSPHRSHQVNPTCGDEITLAVVHDGQTVTAVEWEGQGCAISQASASLLSTLLEGRPLADVAPLIAEFRTAIQSRGTIELDEERFGDAIALNGVSKYVARVKCAMLAWVALEDALA